MLFCVLCCIVLAAQNKPSPDWLAIPAEAKRRATDLFQCLFAVHYPYKYGNMINYRRMWQPTP